MLLDQAQQLMRWRDYEEAERLVTHAKGLRVNYGPFEAKPDALLERIVEAKRQAAPANSTPPATDCRACPRSGCPGTETTPWRRRRFEKF